MTQVPLLGSLPIDPKINMPHSIEGSTPPANSLSPSASSLRKIIEKLIETTPKAEPTDSNAAVASV